MTAAENKYHITVGLDRPKTVKIGTIERGSGQTIVKERGETLAKRGDCGFPNGAKIWAARVINGEIPKNDKGELMTVSVTDPAYKGEVKRLKWGENGGSLISVRYLKGYPTLDVLYQERILNFKVDETNENAGDIYMLTYPNGDNDFDETIDPLLIEHLKGHTYNRDSKSKDPNFGTFMFFEKNFDQEEVLESKVLDEKFEAGKVLRECVDGANETQKCKNLFSIVKSITDEEVSDEKMYAYLKMIVDKKPTAFLEAIHNYKKNLSNIFSKLESYEVLDLTTDGTVVSKVKNKKGTDVEEIIVTDLPAKGKGIFEYLLKDFADPKSFETSFKLIQISDKLK